jgi:uncharacterized protein YfaS (alpha-2-macroglobulin family)
VPADRLGALLDRVDRTVAAGEGTPYDAYLLAIAGRSTGTWLDVMADRPLSLEDRCRLALAFARRGDAERAKELLARRADDARAADRARERGGSFASPLRDDALLLEALDASDPRDARVAGLVARLTAALTSTSRSMTTQEDASALLALLRHHAPSLGTRAATSGVLVAGGRETPFARGGASVDVGPGAPWTFSARTDGPVVLVVRTEGVPERGADLAADRAVSRGATIRRSVETLAGEKAVGPLALGRAYRVVLEGTLPADAEQTLVTDVLPGGLEVDEARAADGDLAPDRVEPRDDRVLFFRAAVLGRGTFRQTYTVRAVTSGTFRQPAARVELLYDPDVFARSDAGAVEVAR